MEFGTNSNKHVSGASVFLINTDNGNTIRLTEADEAHVPAGDIFAAEGETWELRAEQCQVTALPPAGLFLEDSLEQKSKPPVGVRRGHHRKQSLCTQEPF